MGRGTIIPAIALAVTTVSGQNGGPAVQLPGAQPPAFSSRAELVVVHVTIRDRQGPDVTAPPRQAFRIFENGAPQAIAFFTGENSPVTVGFLVDSSGSMREGRERVIAAATAFAEASDSGDELFAIAFNEHVRPALSPSEPFTSDASVFRVALAAAMGAQGRTAMSDAISNGLAYIAKDHHPRRALVVVGDGGDNASTTTFDQLLKDSQTSNAAIYSVGSIDPLEREANPHLLKRLAAATGGASLFPRHVNEVDDVLRKIAYDLLSHTLGYVPSNSGREGQFRRIRVVVEDPARRSLQVRARDGYRAGEPWQGR